MTHTHPYCAHPRIPNVRVLAFMLLGGAQALNPSAFAAAAPAALPSNTAPNDETLTLSPFSVSADRDVGYIASGSLAGSRLNTELKDTAASLSVLTKEFMEDIGATSFADALAWSTNSQLTQGDVLALASASDDVNSTFFNFDSFRVRGLSATQTKTISSGRSRATPTTASASRRPADPTPSSSASVRPAASSIRRRNRRS
jgi:outer membrane receptor protein involved in Fe transport